MNKLKIGIFGAGGSGLLLGAYLLPQHDVVLYCRKRHANAIKENGLKISGVMGEKVINIRATDHLNKKHFDLGIIAVKLYDTYTILGDLDKQGVSFDMVASLQNGLKDDYLRKVFGLEKILGCVFNEGTEIKSPGHVVHVGRGCSYFGTHNKSDDKKKLGMAKELSDTLTNNGLKADISDQMELITWYKFMTAVSGMAVSGSLDFNGAQNYLNQYSIKLRIEVVKEIKAICKAEGIFIKKHPLMHKAYLWDLNKEEEIIKSEIKAAEKKYIKNKAKPHVNSLVQDLRRGKTITEADDILGVFIKKAEKHNLSVPVIKSCYRIIKAREYDNLIRPQQTI